MLQASRGRGWRVAAIFLAASSALAQSIPTTTESPNDYPAALPARKGQTPPAIVFKLVAEIPLPASPTGQEPVLDGGRLLVPVEGGVAAVEFANSVAVLLEGAEPASPEAASAWVLSDDGKSRVRTLPAGRVEAQKKGLIFRRFRHDWSLRAPGATLAPAIIMGGRVLYGSLDNQVYCVRRKNGHRLWAVDLDDRISRPLAAWHGKLPVGAAPGRPATEVEIEMALVVPDGGATLFAIDVYDGSRLGAFQVPSGKGMLASGPIVLAGGRVAVTRTNYGSGGGSLLLLEPAVSEGSPKTGPK